MNRAQRVLEIGEAIPGMKKRNKYGVSAPADRTFDGKVYASKAEMIRAKELREQISYGHIVEVVEQPRVTLGCRENVYVPDFLVCPAPELGEANTPHYEDVKGMETAAFRKNKKLWARYGRLDLHILTRTRDGWDTEIVSAFPHTPESRTAP